MPQRLFVLLEVPWFVGSPPRGSPGDGFADSLVEFVQDEAESDPRERE